MTKKRLGDCTQQCLPFLKALISHRCRELSEVLGRVCVVTLAVAFLGATWGAPSLMAKKKKPPTTKTVRGQVLDASDDGIAGAAVEMTNLTTGKKTAIYTGSGGHFTFTGLKTFDDYQFRATYKGQVSETRKVSSWDTRMRMVVNLHIPPPKD
ncbi:MAG: carboxypeptidase-like regulatory domain-containing protein [Acidobacteria bacterium]|nr:carboxypeptidase-like regulatory domain-containing protein [Acidobacteriota bacterium]